VSRIFFGLFIPVLMLITSAVYAWVGQYDKAAFFAVLGMGNAILWNMEVKK